MNYTINLKENASAGYQWLPDDSSKYLIKSKTYHNPSKLLGGSVDVSFEIMPLTDEPFEVVLNLKRPFEDKIVETRKFKFNE